MARPRKKPAPAKSRIGEYILIAASLCILLSTAVLVAVSLAAGRSQASVREVSVPGGTGANIQLPASSIAAPSQPDAPSALWEEAPEEEADDEARAEDRASSQAGASRPSQASVHTP